MRQKERLKIDKVANELSSSFILQDYYKNSLKMKVCYNNSNLEVNTQTLTAIWFNVIYAILSAQAVILLGIYLIKVHNQNFVIEIQENNYLQGKIWKECR